MYPEDDLIMISALQHYQFCPRQCALIHLEQIWVENRFTAEGRLLHERADSGEVEQRGNCRIERDVGLRSLRLGLIGKADVVEFHKTEAKRWQPFPVEYKRGRPKKDNCDRVQLCAQAICLEEMLGVNIAEGALFYGKTRRRQSVVFDDTLRRQTESLAEALHTLLNRQETPRARLSPKCTHCSLREQCLPEQSGVYKNVADYLRKMVDLS